MSRDEIASALNGVRPFRANQILKWIYGKYVLSPEDMTDLPLELRALLPRLIRLEEPGHEATLRSDDGRTVKFATRFRSGEAPVESVLMFNEKRRPTFCVSSQVGCLFDCSFCRTAGMGFRRNLETAEILYQVWSMRRELHNSERQVHHNVVFMGMGEALANRNALDEALVRLKSRDFFAISPRHTTVSTAGIPRGIEWLAEKHPQVNVALSLNAPNDAIRRKLMPTACRGTNIAGLIDALKRHHAHTGRLPTIEYVLIDQVNSEPRHAEELGRTLASLPCLVNLIPLNEHCGSSLIAPSGNKVEKFRGILRSRGYRVTVRQSSGYEIGAGCGQLSGSLCHI